MKENFIKIRYGVQGLFLILTLVSIRIGSPLINKLMIVTLIFILGTYYCGWICAFGTIQDYLSKFGKKYIKKRLVIPEKYHRYLQWVRYISLFISLGAVMTVLDSRKVFLSLISGRGMIAFSIVFLIFILALSVFIDRPFCKYLCPEGARYGTLSMARLFTVTRNESSCINCSSCDRNCPMGLKISETHSLNTPQCISCGLCINKCPVPDTLSLKLRNFKNPVTYVFFVAGIYFIAKYIIAVLKRFG